MEFKDLKVGDWFILRVEGSAPARTLWIKATETKARAYGGYLAVEMGEFREVIPLNLPENMEAGTTG